MKSAALRNEMVAIALAVLWLAVAFMVVGLVELFDQWPPPVKIEGPVLIALMLLPLGVYFVASGKLIKFKVPGLEASFAEKAEKIPTTIDFNDAQIVGRKLLEAQARHSDQSRPVVMTMTIGRKVGYTVAELKRHLDFLSPVRSFKLVVFLDIDKRVVAYMEAWALKELVEQTETERADELVQSINSGQKQSVIGNPSVTDKVIPTSSTNIDALGEMQKQNLEALVVVNNQGKLAGVVERDQVLTSIVLSLAR